MSASANKKSVGKKSLLTDIPLAEWIVGALGLVIVLAAVGVLVWEAVAGDHSPPKVQLSVKGITPAGKSWLVKVQAKNEGGEPAARVAITVELVQAERVIEAVETEFDYLPAHSTSGAGVFFTRDPQVGELRLRARSYVEP